MHEAMAKISEEDFPAALALLIPFAEEGCISDLDNPGIAGFAYFGIYCNDGGDRLAYIYAFGCISKQHTHLKATLTEMEPAFQAILQSFRFI